MGILDKSLKGIVAASLLLAFTPVALAASQKLDELAVSEATSELPARMIIIGDAHGDYDQYKAVLMEAELINERGNWTGEEAVLVQLGDVVDRGPDSRKILDLLKHLERTAPRKGGKVYFVIGNHEAMNMKGDLRYVHPGEFEAFKTSRSPFNRDEYYKKYTAYLKKNLEGGELLTFDDAYRKEWDETHPLGWIEQRDAWAPDGPYGGWVLERKAVVKVGNLLFAHGGIGPKYAAMPIDEINRRVREDLKLGQDEPATITNEEEGPMWYRGLAMHDEAKERAHVEALLDFYDVDHIVVGHTPLAEAIVPRFGGKVIVADVGLSAHYGNAFAFVEVIDGVIYANQRGQRMLLPMEGGEALMAYLKLAGSLEENPERLVAYQEKISSQP